VRRERETPLADALAAYVRKLDRGGGHLVAARVTEAWPRAAGHDIARHTAGVFLREGELVVYVDSSVWATELTALGEQLRKSLNETLGQELVRTIRFTVSRKVHEERQRERAEQETEDFYAEDLVEPVPLTDAEIEQVGRSAAVIKDESLREAAIRATVKDLEWKRGLERREAAGEPPPNAGSAGPLSGGNAPAHDA
jgi:hypothetical protein